MLLTIFKYEWKQISRSKLLLAGILLFTFIGLFCLQQGKVVYQFQQVSVDSVMAKKQRNYDRVKKIFDTITHTAGTYNNIEEPFVLEWQLQDAAAKKLSPVSILSIGQSDIYSPLLSTHFNRPVFSNEFAEFQNPEKLLAGNLDVSFFVLFLFPLLFIALSYNIRSADKEAGTETILSVQYPSLKILFYTRLFFRWLAAITPALAVAAVSFVILSAQKNFSATTWAQWWIVAFMYSLFWLLLVAFVLQFQLSSIINAFVLAGIWVMLLIALPGLLNTWNSYKNPQGNKTELASYRDFDYKTWDKPFTEHRNFIFSRYPALRSKDFSADADSMFLQSFSYSLMVLEEEIRLHRSMQAAQNKYLKQEKDFFWLNPAGGVMRSFASLGNSTLRQQQEFENAVIAYREQKLKYLWENVLAQSRFTKNDFEAMPKYTSKYSGAAPWQYLLPLFCLQLVLLVFLYFKRKD